MSERKNGKQDPRSGPSQEELTLEEILKEFSGGPEEAAPAAPPAAKATGKAAEKVSDKVLLFPGARRLPEEPEDGGEGDTEEPDAPAESGRDKVVLFPEPKPKNPLASLVKTLSEKADDYAERMFEAEELLADEETRRMEALIPGVDEEDRPARSRRSRREDPPEPDLPPQELMHQYTRGLRSLGIRACLVLVLFLPALYLLLQPTLPLPGVPLPQAWEEQELQLKLWASAFLLAAAMLLSGDLVVNTVRRLLRLRFGMDTLLLLACAATLADALTMQSLQPREQLPCCAVNMLGLYLGLRGERRRRLGLRLACRTASASAEPYLVTLDEDKWNGRSAYAKWSGTAEGFGSQIQADDGAQRIFRVFCPVLLVGCVALSLLASVGQEQGGRIWWCLSSTLTAAAALSAPMLFSRPFYKVTRRLARSNCALAGWPGAADARQGEHILLTDLDLFPPGSVYVSSIKVFGALPEERVIGYTATLIRESGSGLSRVFHDLLRSQGAVYRKAAGVEHHEGGGISAEIRGSQVLVGSAAFMSLMEVTLPQGLSVKNAVFCAIDGELAGIFALNYELPDLAYPAVSALLREGIEPVLATRDFNLIPAMLQQRFKLDTSRMTYPPVDRRRELSDPEQPHSGRLAAVLCREGLYPFCEAVVGARRLRTSVKLGAALACAGSALGAVLAGYLSAAGAHGSLSALNLMVYLVLWLVPAWFITGWADQF